MKDHAALAREGFIRGYNCAQAVACAFCEELNMEEATVAKMVSGFGGGFGKLREVCGAVSGAVFVLSALKGYDDPAATSEKSAHYLLVQEFASRFKAAHDTLICRELLKNLSQEKVNSPQPQPRTPEYYHTRPCVRFVETAAQIVDELLAQ